MRTLTSLQLDEFVRRLSEILGPDIAQRLFEEALSADPPGTRMLPGDGVEAVSTGQRRRAMAYIAEFTGR